MDIKKLINAAPFEEETRQELLRSLEALDEDKKMEIEQLCWGLISTDIQNQMTYLSQQAMAESMTSGKFPDFDYQKKEQDFLLGLLQKMGEADTEEKIEEIRNKLSQANKG